MKAQTIPLGLRIIATFKLVTALLLAAAALGIFRLIGKDIGDVMEHLVLRMHLDPENHVVSRVLEWMDALDIKHLKVIEIAALFYATLYTLEGVGLWLGKHWAEYLVVIATGSLLPLEIYEIAMKMTALRFSVLGINVVIVIYLIRQLRRGRHR
jgi:uncharacterized membrane protein (DUF2068 family)